MKFKYLGQGSFYIHFGGKTILTDPAMSINPLAKDLDWKSLKPDVILLSHGHGDHVVDLQYFIDKCNPMIISTYELVSYFTEQGGQGHGMNTGGKYKFDFGTVKLVTAVHSSVLPDGTYGSNPVGFVVWNKDNCFYFAGDTALTMDMKLIPMTCPKLDVAILPVGDNFTMGYEDALIASTFIDCDQIIGCHFDSFPPIVIDHHSAKAAFKGKNKTLILTEPKIEEIIWEK